MIKRYANPKIAQIFSDENKLELWQETELAVIGAMEDFQFIRTGIFEEIGEILRMFPIDLEWWEKRDEEIHHDLNAFLDERLRHLNAKYHKFFHKNITSYDTEEPAFGRMLTEATDVIMALTNDLEETLINLAIKYRYTIMNARTHGQEAELQSFGARCLTWLVLLTFPTPNYPEQSGNMGAWIHALKKELLIFWAFLLFMGQRKLCRAFFTHRSAKAYAIWLAC